MATCCGDCGRQIRQVKRLPDLWEDKSGQMVCPITGDNHKP